MTHAAGRGENALAASESFGTALKKLGPDGQIVWYADVPKFITLIVKSQAKGKNAANAEQFKAMTQVLGIGGLKAAGGTVKLNNGPFDSLTKTFVVAPAPLQGVLKLLVLPRVGLKPEAWVPATVATYQSWSWDLDAAFVALNDLANMFQPGVLNVLEQQLVGPNGGEPINFKKDVFDPLGDRITLISDFKKPLNEESQRMVLGVALEDAAAFQATLTKIIALAGVAPEKREFQGVTIYDFPVPEIPNQPAGAANPLKGPISVAIAKNTLFAATEPGLLEQVLRGGGPALADNPGYQAVAKELPDKTSALTFAKPDESAPRQLRLDQERPVREAAGSRGGRRRAERRAVRQDCRQGQDPRILRLRQISRPRRRVRDPGGRRDHDLQLHAPESQSLSVVEPAPARAEPA